MLHPWFLQELWVPHEDLHSLLSVADKIRASLKIFNWHTNYSRLWAVRDPGVQLGMTITVVQERGSRMREKKIKVCWSREMENIALILDFPGLALKRPGNILFLSLKVHECTCSNLTINPFYWSLIICANAHESPWDDDWLMKRCQKTPLKDIRLL